MQQFLGLFIIFLSLSKPETQEWSFRVSRWQGRSAEMRAGHSILLRVGGEETREGKKIKEKKKVKKKGKKKTKKKSEKSEKKGEKRGKIGLRQKKN